MEENSRSEEEEDNQVAVLPRCYWPGQNTLPAPTYYHNIPQRVTHPAQMTQVDLIRPYPTYEYPYTASSSRQLRNQAEKQRRDKLNQCINELAILVPMVSSSGKKLDKTSILRLSGAFLRMHQTLGGHKAEPMKDLNIPMEWCKTFLDGMEGLLVVLSSTGKIIYISENVEKILGHHQNDLLGWNLSKITHPEDHDKLKRNLEPSKDVELTTVGIDRRPERRSFFLRLKQRAASRSDQPQYETVHVEGHLRIPSHHQPQNRSKTHAFERYLKAHLSVTNGNCTDIKGEGGTNSNDVVFVALMRPYKEKVSDNSLLEATKEEWISRHLIDGTIVFADHRISVLSGYMSEEVAGSSGFKYMHKEDVRWVMIALRQMFCNKESFGWSCYRLQAKNGEYIYLRTHGYLELDGDPEDIKSFICVNSLVSASEGERLIRDMKNIFTPVIKKKVEPLALPERSCFNNNPPSQADTTLQDPVNLQPLEASDPRELNLAIDLLLSDLNHVTARPPSPDKRDSDYTKVEIVSRALPPVEVQTGRIGAKFPVLQGKYNRPSVITSITGSTERQKRPQEAAEEGEPKRLRPEGSVIVSETRSVIKRHDPESDDMDTNFIFSTDLALFTSDEDTVRIHEVSNVDLWDTSLSELEEGVLRGHLHLENRIQSQGVQIEEIETDLQTVPLSGSTVYRHITHLKAEHRKQQEMLKTLQHEHQNIHQVKDQLSLRGTEQDIGA